MVHGPLEATLMRNNRDQRVKVVVGSIKIPHSPVTLNALKYEWTVGEISHIDN